MKLVFDVEDKPKLSALIIYGFQQVLAIMAATIAVPLPTLEPYLTKNMFIRNKIIASTAHIIIIIIFSLLIHIII